MARAGIQYSQVLQAAEKLSGEGKNPTVDAVRDAMGGTGSKSTIAPLLKRWKSEHQSALATVQSGLPEPLLQAVKGLHQHMLTQVEQELEQARQAHAAVLLTLKNQAQELDLAHQATLVAKTALAKELDAVWQDLLQLQAEQQTQTVALAGVQADNAGLQQRLADRAAEVAAVNQQLSQTRIQFEHYQEAAAIQRTQERQAHEQKISAMAQDLLLSHHAHAAQQTVAGRQEAQLSRLTQDVRVLDQALLAANESLEAMRVKSEHLAYQLSDMCAQDLRTKGQFAFANQQLFDAKVSLASANLEHDRQSDQVRRLEARANQLFGANAGYRQALAALRQSLATALPVSDRGACQDAGPLV